MGRGGSGVEIRETSIRLAFTYQGKPHRETLTVNGAPMPPTAANIKHAHRLVDTIRTKIRAGVFELGDFFPDSPRAVKKVATDPTFGDMGDTWLETKGRLATKTKDQYSNALEVWKGLLGADTRMSKLTHAVVAAKVGKHPWASAKLLNNYLIVLRGVFTLASRELRIENPMEGVENSRTQAPAPDPLGRDETELILADLAKHYSPQVANYFTFAFLTGMRPEEMIALRWDDIDWIHQTVRVERAKTAGEIKPLKTYQTRDVDLLDRTLEVLRSQKEHTFMLAAEIFYNPVTNRPWHDERSQRDHYWAPSLRRLGIRARRAYQTRHTYATTALLGQANPAYVSKQMGHKNAKMLFTIYSKWIDGADRGRERAKLDALYAERESPRNPPEAAGPDKEKAGKALKINSLPAFSVGRRDWTRTKKAG